jgi:hypothetical protein
MVAQSIGGGGSADENRFAKHTPSVLMMLCVCGAWLSRGGGSSITAGASKCTLHFRTVIPYSKWELGKKPPDGVGMASDEPHIHTLENDFK